MAYHYILPFLWVCFAIPTVLLFFYELNLQTQKLALIPDQVFRKKIISISLVIRVLWVLFSYFFYQHMNGTPFEFSAADSQAYHKEAIWVLEMFRSGHFDFVRDYYLGRLSDTGYPIYLIIVYSVFGESILLVRFIKAIIGAITVLLIYKLTKRNFGESTARIAGLLACIYPNLIYHTGLHVKETEMVFFTLFFLERSDYLLRQKKIHIPNLILILSLGSLLYFFRAVLSYSVFLSLSLAVIFSEKKTFHLKQKISLVIVFIILLLMFTNNSILNEAKNYWGDRIENQERSLEQRTRFNKFARYGSSTLFAPLMLIAPLPTLVNIENQKNHMLMSGGFFVKNVLAFFVLIALIKIFRQKTWREHILILALLAIYLAILSMSKFAIVERFHMPVLPLHIILSAYGIRSFDKKNIAHFNYYLIFLALLIIGWNWFKLAGRGIL